MGEWFNRNRALAQTGFWVLVTALMWRFGVRDVPMLIMVVWALWVAKQADKARLTPQSTGGDRG